MSAPRMVAVATILVVDDEPRIVQLVRDYLEHGVFTVLTAVDGPTALRTARTGRPDLVVLDLGLPGLDGLDVACSLRREGEVPIIMLTARTEESDKLVGLELGADDYLTKPFSPKELVAGVRAVLRRAEGAAAPSDLIRVGSDVELDVARMEARFGGRRMDLTKSEFQIVALMARQPGRVFTRAQLLDAVRGVAFESYERAIDAHIKNIRKKVGQQYIETVFGGVRRMTRPMNNLIDAARRIESGDYSAQVPEWGSQDIRSVARAFNSMSARLKTIDEQRRNFMAEVTHELRTPLSVIRGQAEAIADGVYPADEAHLAPILDATHTLDRLVEDLKTLVDTDAGNLVLHREPTDLRALVRDTVESFRPQAESAGITLTTEIAENLPPKDVDPSRIRQVVGNLLSNAIRHTPSGGSIKVAVDASGFTVADTGEGISPELQPHVFERFAKGPNSTGSGLGLAIAQDIVRAHSGSIQVSSSASGTTLTVTLLTASG